MSSTSSIYGFTSSGIDVNTLVGSLMQIERAPITALQKRQTTVTKQISALDSVTSKLGALTSYATSLTSATFAKMSASVSGSSSVSATVTGTAVAGGLTFSVDRLASTRGVRSVGTVGATTAKVTDDAHLALSTTTAPLGISGLRAGSGLTAGNLSVEVTQATTAATKSGTTAIAATTIVTGVNDTVDLEIDGVARTVTIAAGAHTPASLVGAVQSGLDASGGGATASIDAGGRLRITTAHEGSAASIRLVGGSALGDLGLSVDGTAITGSDGTVRIGSTVTTVSSARPGEIVSAATATGSLELTLSGGLRTGSSTVAVVATGDGSLGSVVGAINASNVGVSATAVKVADGQYRLQISSVHTGIARNLAIGDDAFAAIGGVIDTSSAQDARIVVGSGPGAYEVLSTSNAFSELMPGISISATATTGPVTVGVTRNDAAVADSVAKLVDLANAVLKEITTQTKYNTATGTAAALTGDATVRRLATEVRAAVSALVTGSSALLAANVGITAGRDGSFTFDRATFTSVLATDPSSIARLFTRGGTTTGNAVFADASDLTNPGSYDVVVTTAATRASTGQVLVGGTPSAQRIGVRVNGTTITYDAPAGATSAEIAAGLNAALVASDLGITAAIDGTGIALTANDVGGAGTFEANLDITGAGAWTEHVGTDVAGTIDGVAAIGVGRRLRLTDLAESEGKGIAVDVAPGATGALGSVTYEPGIAARLTILGRSMTGANGSLTSSTASYRSRIDTYTAQIDRYEDRMVVREATLKRQWTSVQTLLSSLESQGSWLSNMAKSSSST